MLRWLTTPCKGVSNQQKNTWSWKIAWRMRSTLDKWAGWSAILGKKYGVLNKYLISKYKQKSKSNSDSWSALHKFDTLTTELWYSIKSIDANKTFISLRSVLNSLQVDVMRYLEYEFYNTWWEKKGKFHSEYPPFAFVFFNTIVCCKISLN